MKRDQRDITFHASRFTPNPAKSQRPEKHGCRVRVEQIIDVTSIKNRYQIPAELHFCHTSLVGGYVVEGHVPVEALAQLLAERPSVKGIAVPGMPIGAPGMEQPGVAAEPYDVLTFDEMGNTAVFSSHNQ